MVQEIAAASQEQAGGEGQIAKAMSQFSQTTQSNASGAEELSATAEEMSAQAERPQQLMGFFKIRRTVAGGRALALALEQTDAQGRVRAQVDADGCQGCGRAGGRRVRQVLGQGSTMNRIAESLATTEPTP